ncbi:hypothetical protein ACFLXD_05030 [Chloroflexota bacterium]
MPIETYHTKMVSDGFGGAIIAWSADSKIYVQRLDSSGNSIWADNRVIFNGDSHKLAIISDGEGGAIIAWVNADNTDDSDRLWAQRVDASGDTLWDDDGICIYERAGVSQWRLIDLMIVSDRAGGAIVTWGSFEKGKPIYGQRIDASGRVVWNEGAVVISSMSYDYVDYKIVSDGVGGMVIAFNSDIDKTIIRRIDTSGKVVWSCNNLEILRASDYQLVPNEAGGVIIVWLNYINDGERILAQRIDASGSILWDEIGIPIVKYSDSIMEFVIMHDGYGGAYIIWEGKHA